MNEELKLKLQKIYAMWGNDYVYWNDACKFGFTPFDERNAFALGWIQLFSSDFEKVEPYQLNFVHYIKVNESIWYE